MFFDPNDLVSGNSNFGIYEVTFEFYSEDFSPEKGGYQEGTYRVSAEISEQGTGNTRYYGNGDDDFPIPSTEFLTVRGAPSGAAPYLAVISSVIPEAVDVSSGDQSVVFNFGVISNGICFGYGSIWLYNHSGNYAHNVSSIAMISLR